MRLALSGELKQFLRVMQGCLFPTMEEALGPLTGKLRQLIAVLEPVQIEAMVGPWYGGVGRPARHEREIMRAFAAKAVYSPSDTRQLLDRLANDVSLRRICGWSRRSDIPRESQFSRAFAGFAALELPRRLHAALIEATQKERLVGHISRDSTEIEAREKPRSAPVEAAPVKHRRKRSRPRKGEPPAPPEPTRLERQTKMTLAEMLDELPKAANVDDKKNSKGYKETRVGYKFHIDAADGQIPIGCILAPASLRDSQAAIPPASMTSQRVTNLYGPMDSAYDAQAIHKHSRSLGHIPIIDIHPTRDQALKEELQAEEKRCNLLNYRCAEDLRYRERTTVERVNARLKDEFGGRTIRVRARHRRGVSENQVSCRRLGSYPPAIDHNAGPEEKIPISTCGLGDFASGSNEYGICSPGGEWPFEERQSMRMFGATRRVRGSTPARSNPISSFASGTIGEAEIPVPSQTFTLASLIGCPFFPFSNLTTILLCCAGHSIVASSKIDMPSMNLFMCSVFGIEQNLAYRVLLTAFPEIM